MRLRFQTPQPAGFTKDRDSSSIGSIVQRGTIDTPNEGECHDHNPEDKATRSKSCIKDQAHS